MRFSLIQLVASTATAPQSSELIHSSSVNVKKWEHPVYPKWPAKFLQFFLHLPRQWISFLLYSPQPERLREMGALASIQSVATKGDVPHNCLTSSDSWQSPEVFELFWMQLFSNQSALMVSAASEPLYSLIYIFLLLADISSANTVEVPMYEKLATHQPWGCP